MKFSEDSGEFRDTQMHGRLFHLVRGGILPTAFHTVFFIKPEPMRLSSAA